MPTSREVWRRAGAARLPLHLDAAEVDVIADALLDATAEITEAPRAFGT